MTSKDICLLFIIYFFACFCFVSTWFYFMKLSSSFVVYLTSCTVISKSSQSHIHFEVIYYPLLNIFCRHSDEWKAMEATFPVLSRKSYFTKDVYLNIRFCVIHQGIQNLFGSSTPRSSSGVLFCENLCENPFQSLDFLTFFCFH